MESTLFFHLCFIDLPSHPPTFSLCQLFTLPLLLPHTLRGLVESVSAVFLTWESRHWLKLRPQVRSSSLHGFKRKISPGLWTRLQEGISRPLRSEHETLEDVQSVGLWTGRRALSIWDTESMSRVTDETIVFFCGFYFPQRALNSETAGDLSPLEFGHKMKSFFSKKIFF